MSAVSLLFAAGSRPSVGEVRQLAQDCRQFALSFDPAMESDRADADGTGWVELLANGLTFDLNGLAPGSAEQVPLPAHLYGLGADFEFERHDAISLTPGPHLAGAGTMFPVVRVLAWLAALLAQLPGAKGVSWHPARSCCSAEHFRDSVLRWIEGGAFPGLGLTALTPTSDGGLRSEGLALFIRQELVLAPELVPDRAEGAKLALRLLHWLVENGEVGTERVVTGPDGAELQLEPVRAQGIIKVTKVL